MTRVNVRKALAIAAVAVTASVAIVGVSAAHPGSGMMGGYGPGYGMGPGMMGGYGPGYGMGPGMMGGYGPGYGAGWDCHAAYGPDLSADQQSKLGSIQKEFARKQFERMSSMHEEQLKLRELFAAPQRDDTAIGASRERLRRLQREMQQAALEARKQMDAVLTPEQREQMRRGWVGAQGM